MRYLFILFIYLFSAQITAQEQQLGYQYLRNGNYKKAASIYKSLLEKHPYNSTYANYLIDCYQQIEHYDEVFEIIENQLTKYPSKEYLYVDYGYTFQLQHQIEKATFYYTKALAIIESSKNSTLGYLVGKAFQDNHLLDYALNAYQKAMKINPKANYNIQIAFIYGEQGEIPKMFETCLKMVELNHNYLNNVKTYIGQFLNVDAENNYNVVLKKLLLRRMQKNPHNNWNHLLSWLYIQQKDYNKAFIQEKALHKRNLEDLKGIINLGIIAYNNDDFETSKNCFQYILDNETDINNELTAKLYLLEISMIQEVDSAIIENQFQQLFQQYGKDIETVRIQMVYAQFLAFNKNETINAIKVLKSTLKLPLNEFEKGRVKTKLADVLVIDNKFNSALIYYTQVQNNLKNHTIGQLARFKIAQTSYFKGDFEWAQTQLKVLKSSTSQLISNDALNLNLLITDNNVKDSLKLALKTYAKADLLSFQNKNNEAINTLQKLLITYKNHPIEDEALFKQAQLYETTNQFEKSETNYLKIIELNAEDILVDDAIYYLAELYLNKLNNPEKAKEYYQKIIFDYPSSIHLVDARKKFRKLRGDILN